MNREPLEPESLRELHRKMLRIRMVEEAICEEYPKQEMRCAVHLSIGQEAVAVGACAALTKEDTVFSSHRAHAHYLAQGGDLRAMIAELYLKATGTCGGRGGSMHLVDSSVGFLGAIPIVGSSIPAAVGAALGFVLQDRSQVALVFFGEAATEEGVFAESLNFAALKTLPVVFVCENNLYSVNSPMDVRQPDGREITILSEALNVPAVKGNGNDVTEVLNLTRQAVNRAREGKGPGLIEFDTYRWREHCGPGYDFDSGYRTRDEFEVWKKRDPLKGALGQLEEAGIWNEEEDARIRREIEVEIEQAFDFAKQSPPPGVETLFESVYAD